MFQRVFPFLLSLPSPALPQCARRAAVRSPFLLFNIFYRLHCSAPHRRSLPSCDTADISARQSPQTPLLFRTEDSPCVLPVCKYLRSVPIVRVASFPSHGHADRTGALSRLCAHSCSPMPSRCFVLGWLLAVTVSHTTIHRIFNHIFLICSILVLTSKMPLHQSAGAFSLLSGLEQVCSSGFLRKSPTRIKR